MQERVQNRKAIVERPWRRGQEVGSGMGHLIVLEGANEVGKTTLASHLSATLSGTGEATRLHAFPGSEVGSLGKLIHQIAKGPDAAGIFQHIDAFAMQLLHLAAHIDGIPRVIGDLRAGKNVVLDRCWWSALVYGYVDGVEEERLERAVALQAPYWEPIRPTCLFLVQRGAIPPAQNTQYQLLAQSESLSYPVCVTNNEGSVEETVQQMLSEFVRYKSSERMSRHPQTTLFPVGVQSYAPIAGSKSTPARQAHPGVRKKAVSPHDGTDVYDTYWHFAHERQAIYKQRVNGESPPWTEDPILLTYRFTNAYRAADRVSQYLIRRVIYAEGDFTPEDTVFRILLYKMFNRIETWEALESGLGDISFRTFSFERYTAVLEQVALKSPVYSAAYIMPPPRGYEHARKYANHLSLLNAMIGSGLTRKLAAAKRMADVFNELLSFAGLGPFLAYQFAIDLNYSELTDFSESEFVVAGPGARSGIRRCFGSRPPLTDGEIIQRATELQESEFSKRGLSFQSLWGRPLQLIDCQNLFCEVDKYARVAHPDPLGPKKRIKQRFASSRSIEQPWFPPKWGINQAIPLTQGSRCF